MAVKPKQKKPGLTGSTKVGISLLSLATLVGGWNVIGRLEAAEAATEPAIPNLAILAPTQAPWPTLGPMAALEPIPTLAPLNPMLFASSEAEGGGSISVASTIVGRGLAGSTLSALPSLAPLPAIPSIPTPPPPPPPQIQQKDSGGSSNSSSSSSGKSSGKSSGGS